MSNPSIDLRTGALRRFAIAISALNLLGHTLLGFEQAWITPLLAVVAAYALELLLEWIDARTTSRPYRFAGGWMALVDFLLPAHITALAVAMLLYANASVLPILFAVAVAVGSKFLFRVPVGRGTRHFLNPSNFGISITLLAFPWVAISPPYQFTENLAGWQDWILPCIIIASGSFLNSRFTGKMPLIAGWLAGFVLQALLRSLFWDASLLAALLPMTGVAFILFTFYMITDPATTPVAAKAQLLFGASVALTYGLLIVLHVVFTTFFALTLVCVARGLLLYVTHLRPAPVRLPMRLPASTAIQEA